MNDIKTEIENALIEARKQATEYEEKRKQQAIEAKKREEQIELEAKQKLEADADAIIANIPNLLKYSYGEKVIKLRNSKYDDGFYLGYEGLNDLSVVPPVARLVVEKCEKLGIEIVVYYGETEQDPNDETGRSTYSVPYLGIKVL